MQLQLAKIVLNPARPSAAANEWNDHGYPGAGRARNPRTGRKIGGQRILMSGDDDLLHKSR
jgi:hypothetical protein